jgi:pimeloyl-ACP methyl ester carboxylesterase
MIYAIPRAFLLFLILLLLPSASLAADIPEGTPPEPDEAVAGAPAEPAIDPATLPAEIVLRDYLVIGQVGTYGRAPLHIDRLEAQLVKGAWPLPKAGETITSPQGAIHKWEPVLADEDGTLSNSALRGGYAVTSVDSPLERVMLLEAQGHGTCWANGQPRAGDPYFTGQLLLPVKLKKGANQFLFHVGGGELIARLVAPQPGDFIDLRDNTLPDLVQGETGTWRGAVLVVNASSETLNDVFLETSLPEGKVQRVTPTSIIPLTARTLAFQVQGQVPSDREKLEIELKLMQGKPGKAKRLDAVKVALEVKKPGAAYRRTFISDIDGSVQFYAVQPAVQSPDKKGSPALLVSLHGAGIEASDQAELYSRKEWAQVIAPTNRRPYGFDWEDWGRIDALEAIADAQAHFKTDPARVLLTGHAMGGHGALHLGAIYPGKFAAVASSAGWISFATYGGLALSASPSDIEQMLVRAAGSSNTLKLFKNLQSAGVYVQQGELDEIVPVAQARMLRAELAMFHPNFAYREGFAADHDWSESELDSPVLIEFLRQQRLSAAEDVRQIAFTTANPGVSSQSQWLTVEAQQQQFEMSKVSIHYEPNQRQFLGTTENVARLSLDVAHLQPHKTVNVTLDGQKLNSLSWPPGTPKLWLARKDDRWKVSTQSPYAQKGPHRYGLFKDALRHEVMFVYGTRGTAEENAWSLAKARYDAETFAYRGNASVDVIADTKFNAKSQPDRNIILYGNADTNGAWPALMSLSPVQVRRDQLTIGTRPEQGDNLACLFIRPRPGSNTASVGVVSGTGLAGLQATNRLRYFVSGIAFPDILIFTADALQSGESEVRMDGYFGLNWSVEEGEFAWRDLAL